MRLVEMKIWESSACRWCCKPWAMAQRGIGR